MTMDIVTHVPEKDIARSGVLHVFNSVDVYRFLKFEQLRLDVYADMR